MKKTAMFLSGLALWGAILATFSTFAFQWLSEHGFSSSANQQRYEQMEKMFENRDYEKFQQFFDWRGPARVIDNKEEFNKFVDLHEAYEEGNMKKAEKLADELDLWGMVWQKNYNQNYHLMWRHMNGWYNHHWMWWYMNGWCANYHWMWGHMNRWYWYGNHWHHWMWMY